MADALGIEIGHFMTSPSLKRSARVALTSICGEDDLLKRLAAHIHAAGVEVSIMSARLLEGRWDVLGFPGSVAYRHFRGRAYPAHTEE